MLGILHFRKLTKMVAMEKAVEKNRLLISRKSTINMQKIGSKIINVKRPENRAHKCDYSCKPSRLLELPISAIRIVHFDYSRKPSRLLALVNGT